MIFQCWEPKTEPVLISVRFSVSGSVFFSVWRDSVIHFRYILSSGKLNMVSLISLKKKEAFLPKLDRGESGSKKLSAGKHGVENIGQWKV